jgi:aryl-alcohol dehydrogenase-like predicted oxidoreductase
MRLRHTGIGAFYGSTDQDQAFKTLTYAADRGITHWDCADIYGDGEYTPPTLFPHK